MRQAVITAALVLFASAAAARADATSDLAAKLASLQNVKTLSAQFVCEKRLEMLETPLVSSGRVWIARGEHNAEGKVRFSTEKPYISELILTDGKVYARSQHEEDWSETNQSSRPGLTAVMGQLGGWATGDPGKLSDLYAVAEQSGQVPPLPADPAQKQISESADVPLFTLTPTNTDLAKSVKQIRLAFEAEGAALRFIEIETAQGDITRYWFSAIQKNTALPPDVFEAKDKPALTPDNSAPAPAKQ